MNIAVDVRILEKKMSGVGRYAQGMVGGFLKVLSEGDKLFILCTDKGVFPQMFPGARIIVTPRPKCIPKFLFSFSPVWLNFVLPKYLKENNIDVFFAPAHFCPVRKVCAKNVIVIHDMAHKIEKNAKSWIRRAYIDWYLGLSVRRASLIATISENSKRDIEKYYPNFPSEKVIVGYNAADSFFAPRDSESPEVQSVKQKYGIKPLAVLYIGKIEERKNIKTIIKVADEVYKLRKDIQFVLVGNKGYKGYEELKSELDARKEKNILHIDYVDDKDLRYIYNGVTVFLFPSLYEGFGLPPLEAMQSGVPVVVSNSSSLPEVVDGAGFVEDALEVESFVKDVMVLLTDSKLHNEFSQKGIKQAAKFSWVISAQKLFNAFKKI